MNDTDHDLLIRIDTKLDVLQAGFANHLRHHWAMGVVVLTATLGLIGALVVALL